MADFINSSTEQRQPITSYMDVGAEHAKSTIEPLVNRLVEQLRADDDPETQERYTPFLRAVHSGSRGYAQRVPGSLTTRLHDFLSRHELHVFLIYDWQKRKYRNIREQFPLAVELTQAIGKREKIPHPFYDEKPSTLSVDFLLSKQDGGWEAVDFKEKKDYAKKKTRQKLDLAAITLAEAGVPHTVMTEDDIPMTIIRNYRFLRIHSLQFDPPPLASAAMDLVESPLRQQLISGRTTIFEAALRVSGSTGIEAFRVARACYWLLANRRWPVDLNYPVGPDYTLQFLPLL